MCSGYTNLANCVWWWIAFLAYSTFGILTFSGFITELSTIFDFCRKERSTSTHSKFWLKISSFCWLPNNPFTNSFMETRSALVELGGGRIATFLLSQAEQTSSIHPLSSNVTTSLKPTLMWHYWISLVLANCLDFNVTIRQYTECIWTYMVKCGICICVCIWHYIKIIIVHMSARVCVHIHSKAF